MLGRIHYSTEGSRVVAKVDSSDQSPLAHEWSNIKTIVNHFGSMIDVWCAANPSSSLSQEKVQ